jgi:folylpolyglutamate synthase/dihydropteroate synthase
LFATWQSLGLRALVKVHDSIADAWHAARGAAATGERILVVGSFVTVGEVLRLIETESAATGSLRH